jgi:hypothetical protein
MAVAVASDGALRVSNGSSAVVGASPALSSCYAVDDAFAQPAPPFNAIAFLARWMLLHKDDGSRGAGAPRT